MSACVSVRRHTCVYVFMYSSRVVISFSAVMTQVAGGGLDKWFSCSLQSSIPTSKTDAIQSIHYQSMADAIRLSQQPLNVYQGQLRPIKPIRHHNVGRHSDEGRALNEASLKRSGKWSCGHWAVSLSVFQTTTRKSPLCLISVSFILFTHLHPTCAQDPV